MHFPLTFFTGAFAIDSLRLLTTPAAVRVFGVINVLKLAGLTQASWWMHIAGLVTSLPAVATGYAEYSTMNADSPATSTAFNHSVLNMAVCESPSHAIRWALCVALLICFCFERSKQSARRRGRRGRAEVSRCTSRGCRTPW